jgi:hypothetical protein
MYKILPNKFTGENQMKKIMMIGLMCLMLIGAQSILAQNTDNNAVSPVITGKMRRDFVKRINRNGDFMRLPRSGSEKASETIDRFNNANVQYDKQSQQWNIFAQVRSSTWNRRKKSWDMWIKYNEKSGLLIISTTKENRNQWTLKKNPKIKITIADNKSTFRLDFLKNFEGTNNAGYNYNWMQNSWLLVTR